MAAKVGQAILSLTHWYAENTDIDFWELTYAHHDWIDQTRIGKKWGIAILLGLMHFGIYIWCWNQFWGLDLTIIM